MENEMGGKVARQPKWALSKVGKDGKQVQIQPSKARTAVDLLWRKATVGYNPPTEFYSYFGKYMMTLAQVKEVAAGWETWRAAAASRYMPVQNDLYFSTALDTMLAKKELEK